MRIVVTGALGHIGSRLIRELPRTFPAAEFLLLDNLAAQRYCSLFDLVERERYRFVEADVLTADLPSLFAGSDVVIHLAALTNATDSFEIQDQVELVNVIGTERIARACVRSGSALIFPSTTSVYGRQSGVITEDCAKTALQPQSPYAKSKLRSEELLRTLGESDGLRYVVCRLGSICGRSPGMHFHTAVSKFCWQASIGQPITVWRTAWEQNRPYLELTDAVALLSFLIQRDLFQGVVYNAVTTNASVRYIVQTIATHLPDTTVEYVDSAVMNALSYDVSSDLIRRQGFEFHGRLEDGISGTLQMLRALRPWKAPLPDRSHGL